MKKVTKSNKPRLKLLHQYYRYTGFYSFVGSSLAKAALPIALFVGALFLLDAFVIDFNALFVEITETYPPSKILSVFFTSESFLGLIPPEIFIAWSHKTPSPIFYLTMLALLSYLGGIVSFFIGRVILKIPFVYQHLEVKMKKHLNNIRKWGGFLIVVGALLPIPFSITSIAAGTINYKFKNYLLYGSLRFLRFYIFAIAIFNIV